MKQLTNEAFSSEESKKIYDNFLSIIGTRRDKLVKRYGSEAEKVAYAKAVKQVKKQAEEKPMEKEIEEGTCGYGEDGKIGNSPAGPMLIRLKEMVKDALKNPISEKAGSTDKYDDNPLLKGKQSELPDGLQKAIINKKGGKTNEVVSAAVRGIVDEPISEETSNNPYYNAIEAKAKEMGMTANDFMKDLLAKEFKKFQKEKGVTDKTIKQAKKDFDAKVDQMGFQDIAKLADAAYMDQMTKDQMDHDEETLRRERGLEEGHTDIENEKLKVISKELKSASKLHKGQAKKLDKITNESVKEAYADLSDEERLKVGKEYDHETIAQAYLNKMKRDSSKLSSDDLLKIGKKVVFLDYDGDMGAAYKDLVKEDINEARGFTTKELRLKAITTLKSLGIQIDDSTVMDMVKTLMDTINKNTAGVVLTNEAHDCATTHPNMSHEEYETSLNEDLDLGHTDDEPGMLKSDLYRIGKYAMELYKMVDVFDKMDGEVDFPHWWQTKITKSKSMLVSAKHYLDFEMKEPQIDAMVGVASEEGVIDEKKLTTAEKNKKEDIIKSIAKQKGGKGKLKDVDYAVATDRAKKLAETIFAKLKESKK